VGLAEGETLRLGTDETPGDYKVSGATFTSANASASPIKLNAGTVTLEDQSEVASNYTLSNGTIGASMNVSGMIYKMPLVIGEVETNGRAYNGFDTVNVTGVTLYTVSDPENALNISRSNSNGYTVVGAKYADANAGTGKQIAEGTVELKGAAATNYEIPEPSLAGFGNDEITKRDLTVSNSSKISKPYDGTAIVSQNNVELAFTGLLTADKDKEGYVISDAAFEDELIGSNKSLSTGTVELTGFLATNYSLTDNTLAGLKGTIGKGKIPIRGVAHTKVYDGTATATDVEFGFDPSDYPLWQGGDLKEQLNSITWTYTSKNAGTKTIKPAGTPTFKTSAPAELRNFYEISTDAVEMAEGGITKKPLAFTSVSHTKPYDGTTTAKIITMSWAPASNANGLVSGDAASTVLVDSVDADYTSATPGTKDVVIKNVWLKGTNGLGHQRRCDQERVAEGYKRFELRRYNPRHRIYAKRFRYAGYCRRDDCNFERYG